MQIYLLWRPLDNKGAAESCFKHEHKFAPSHTLYMSTVINSH